MRAVKLGSKIVQVKGVMPLQGGLTRETPTPAEPLGDLWYGITFLKIWKKLC